MNVLSRLIKALLVCIAGCMLLYCSVNIFETTKIKIHYANKAAEHQYAQAHPIIVQLCLPDRVVAFENVVIDMSDVSTTRNSDYYKDLYKIVIKPAQTWGTKNTDVATVRKWIPNPGDNGTLSYQLFGQDVDIGSSGKGSMFRLIGNTTASQPVYHYKWTRQVKDIRGLEVTISNSKAKPPKDVVLYWFIPPSDIPKNQFTDWQEPISQEVPIERQYSETWYKIMHGKKFDINPVNFAKAPMVRYMVAEKNDYLLSHQFPERLQWTITKKNYSNITDEQREKLWFSPAFEELIPSCTPRH